MYGMRNCTNLTEHILYFNVIYNMKGQRKNNQNSIKMRKSETRNYSELLIFCDNEVLRMTSKTHFHLDASFILIW